MPTGTDPDREVAGSKVMTDDSRLEGGLISSSTFQRSSSSSVLRGGGTRHTGPSKQLADNVQRGIRSIINE